MLKLFKNFIYGMAFGSVETVPGFSGGTIAIILGFYDELIKSVNNFRKDYKKSLKFLIPLLLGIAAGVVLFSSLMTYLLTNYSFPTMIFFIGLIVGIIPLIYSKIKEPGHTLKIKEIILIIIPVLILIIISHLKKIFSADSVINPAEIIQNINFLFMLFIFFAGIIAAAALIIPGISGSFVLLLFGIYPLAIHSVKSIKDLLTDITNVQLLLDICKVLVPLAIGVIIGVLSMARLIEKLLTNYNKIIYSIILGLLLGSVYALFNDPILFQTGTSAPFIIIGIFMFMAGCVISFILGKKRF